MHLRQKSSHLIAKLAGKEDIRPSAGLTVKEGTLRYSTAEHLLHTHGLGAQLEKVGIMGFGTPSFVFYRIGALEAFFTLKRDTGRIGVELHYITLAGDS